MSPSAFITRRQRETGVRYVVRFRFGGRASPLIHGGSFARERDARARRDLIIGELAAGRDPRITLATLAAPPARRTLDQAMRDFAASRVDVGAKAQQLYALARARLGDLDTRDPATLRPIDFQAWIAANSDLSPGSLRAYLSAIRQALDFAGVDPNPARNKTVKLPTASTEEPTPPTLNDLARIRARIRKRSLLSLRVMEATGLRTSELHDLEYGDVDFIEGRFRISSTRTKRGTSGRRWVPVPGVLLDEIADLTPVEDRDASRRVFPATTDSFGYDLRRACELAGILHYHPHDLRHRRISLWIAHGIDPVTVQAWAGHSKASISTDVYGHVLMAGDDEWRDFWLDQYARKVLPRGARTSNREAPVRSTDGEEGSGSHG